MQRRIRIQVRGTVRVTVRQTVTVRTVPLLQSTGFGLPRLSSGRHEDEPWEEQQHLPAGRREDEEK